MNKYSLSITNMLWQGMKTSEIAHVFFSVDIISNCDPSWRSLHEAGQHQSHVLWVSMSSGCSPAGGNEPNDTSQICLFAPRAVHNQPTAQSRWIWWLDWEPLLLETLLPLKMRYYNQLLLIPGKGKSIACLETEEREGECVYHSHRSCPGLREKQSLCLVLSVQIQLPSHARFWLLRIVAPCPGHAPASRLEGSCLIIFSLLMDLLDLWHRLGWRGRTSQAFSI